jgi:hypothetical protein
MTWRRLALGVALLALGCGNSRAVEAAKKVQAVCEGLAASGATAQDATNEFITPYGAINWFLVPPCPLPVEQTTCAGPPADECRYFFEFGAADPSQCSPIGGCCFVCDVHVSGGAAANAKVCASRWLSGQICQ